MLTIKKGDMVKVIAGRDQGKTGRVMSVNRAARRVLVEHVQMVKRHMRANPSKNVKGGILERESAIHQSNVMLLCPSCGPIRPRSQELPDGKKVRACRKCGNTLD
ncbi:MAG: 50S ribosomal protein L24 [Acidobacteria bacterium]|nr:50S ribosomal protein L24 [Acidobacteriota bacterium]